MVAQELMALPTVSKANSADIMNVLLQLRVDFAQSQARHDVLLEGIKEKLANQDKQLTDLSRQFSESQAHNGITREMVTQLQRQSADAEARLRGVEKDVEDLKDTRDALMKAEARIEALEQKVIPTLTNEVNKLKESRAWLVGWSAGAGAVAAIALELLLRYVIR